MIRTGWVMCNTTNRMWRFLKRRSYGRCQWIEAHRLDVCEKQYGPDQIEAHQADAIDQHLPHVRLGFGGFQGDSLVGESLSCAFQLDARICSETVVPAAEMVAGLNPQNIAILNDDHACLVALPILVKGVQHTLRITWLQGRLEDPQKTIEE